MARKRTLGRVIEEWIAANHTSNAALAQLLGVNPDSLRLWVKKNSFPPELIAALGKHLHMETDPAQLARRLSFGLNEKRGPAARIVSVQPEEPAEAESVRSCAASEDFPGAWSSLLHERRRGDFIAWVGLDAPPPELDRRHWPSVAPDLVEALRRGVDLLYLHAGPTNPDHEADSGELAELRVPSVGREPWDWTPAIATLRENLRFELRQAGVDAEEAERCVRAHVIEVALGPTSFMTPGHLYASVRCFDLEQDTYVPRGFCVLAGLHGSLLVELAHAAADPLGEFVASVVETYLPERREIAHRVRPPDVPTLLKVVPPAR